MADDRKDTSQQPMYLSYLLRLWRVSGGEQPVWRASLKSAITGEQVGFATLEELFDYLRAEAEGESGNRMPCGGS